MSSLQNLLLNTFTAWGMGDYAAGTAVATVAALKLVLILILAKVAMVLGRKVIARMFKNPKTDDYLLEEKRAQTLTTLLQSALFYVVSFMVVFQTLKDIFGLPVESLLAGAGVVGLAVGFGAQSLVKDVITGFFLIFENQFAVGEFIVIDQAEGTVEEIGLRVTKLRAMTGELHIIPNGSIVRVINKSRGFQLAVVEVSVAYETEIDRATAVLEGVAAEMNEDYQESLLEDAKVLGVVRFGSSEIVLRVVAKTKPLEHWAFEREFRRRIKLAFDREGIEIPYPKQVMLTPGEPSSGVRLSKGE